MRDGLFPESVVLDHNGLSVEVVWRGAGQQRQTLDALKNDVLRIAALSRGWEEPANIKAFASVFKIEPLYATNALALVWKRESLVGLGGAMNEWGAPEGSILHLCSLGFLPEIQGQGLLPVLLYLLFKMTLLDPEKRNDYLDGRVFVSAITQSPYILSLLRRFADIYPSPNRSSPALEELAVARRVVLHFDPEVEFEEDKFVLRNECKFRYRHVPYSRDRTLNQFCDRLLRYDQGDTFIVVGRVTPASLEPFFSRTATRYAEVVQNFNRALPSISEVNG